VAFAARFPRLAVRCSSPSDWGWDPVQNAALLPWLSSTALLHSIRVQERRGSWQRWNVLLIGITFLLCIFARFLVHSDIVQSIHAYGQGADGIATTLGGYLFVLATGFAALVLWRLPKLVGRGSLDVFAYPDGGVLFGNFVLAIFGALVLLGTLWPAFSESVEHARIQVGPLFFERCAKPLGIVALIGIGTSVWAGRRHPARLASRLVHLGLFVLMLGFSGASRDWEAQHRLTPGESWSIGPYTIEYRTVEALEVAGFPGARARLALRVDGRPRAMLLPERHAYLQQGTTWSRPAIYSTWREDLHVILVGVDSDQSILLAAVGKPLVQWVWIGGWMLLLGGTLLLSPQRATSHASTLSEPDRPLRPLVPQRE